MVGADLNAEVAGAVVSDSIIHRIWGRAAPRPLPRQTRWTRRARGSLRSLRSWRSAGPGCSCCAGGPGGAGSAFFRDQAPEAGARIGLMIGSGLNADEAGAVVLHGIIHRIRR